MADLSVKVTGPATASEGDITYTVTVRNHGPSTVGYKLILDENNSDLTCGHYGFEGPHSKPALAAGATRAKDFTTTCTDAHGSAQESLDARVRGPADPTPGNNRDRVTTAVSP